MAWTGESGPSPGQVRGSTPGGGPGHVGNPGLSSTSCAAPPLTVGPNVYVEADADVVASTVVTSAAIAMQRVRLSIFFCGTRKRRDPPIRPSPGQRMKPARYQSVE